MQLVVWIGLCAGIALLLRKHPTISIVCVLVLWFLVPTVGSYLLTGQQVGPLSFHCATWLIVAIAVVQLVWSPEGLRTAVMRHQYLVLLLALVLSVAVLTTQTVQTGGGMVLFVDQMMAPVAFFLLILATGKNDVLLVPRLRNAMLLLVGISVTVSIFQWFTGNVLFYEAGFKTQFWFNPDTQRWMGTFDQPLALSLVSCVLAPLVAGIRRLYVAVPLLALLVVGVLITQSRVGVGAIVLSTIYAVVFSRHRASIKVVVIAVLAAATYFLLSTPLVAGILGRVSDDTGSTEARNQAYGVFVQNWANYLFTGDGLTASYGVADFAGLQTSFESSLLMYAVDIGIIFAVLYFGAMLLMVLKSAGRHSIPGLTLAGLLVIFIPQVYSGVATRSVAGIVLWTVVAMAVVAAEAAEQRATQLDLPVATRGRLLTTSAHGYGASGGRVPSIWSGR